jgi:putative ABC transport system permease protein
LHWKQKGYHLAMQSIMLINYLKITFRNLARNKTFSIINIFGLAAGLATCLLIMLYIKDESEFDKHHKDGDRIFRIASASSNGESWAAAPAPLAFTLKNDLPEVEEVSRLFTFPDIETMTLKVKQASQTIQFIERNGYYVDSTYFRVLTYDFKYGNAHTALNQPNSIVISGQIAGRFFGRENPLGRTMVVVTPFGEMNYTVNGVFDNTKHKTHIPANYFLSMRNSDMFNFVQRQTGWASNNVFYTYVKFKPGVLQSVFEKKLNPWFQSHAGEQLKAAGFGKTLFLQPLKDIYLHSAVGFEFHTKGNITYLYILGSIAAFILLIACINFMNLSTARSERRAKEVGVRKVMGAVKHSLVYQFLGESVIMCVIAMGISLLLAGILLPYFNSLTQKNLQPFDQPYLLLWIGLLTLATGLLAGLYPAFYLSSFKPVSVLKGKIINHFSAAAIRKGLVVFQFTISICLIFGAIVIWQQLSYLKNQNLGFNKERQLVLPLTLGFNNSEANYVALKSELVKLPQVKAVSSASAYPGIPNLNDMLFFAEGKTVRDFVDIHLASVQHDYIPTLGLELKYGRNFSSDIRVDSQNIILNETAVKQLGYDPATAVGKKIYFKFAAFNGFFNITGIVKDFHYESLHTGIKPYGFTTAFFGNRFGYLIANLKTGDYANTLARVETIWKKAIPNAPFNYSFVDQDFQRNYENDQLTSRIVLTFTVITILIACLGLFGLAAFSAEQRTREIGIRKVLGASVANITRLLSKDFLRLVVIALLIASPLSWYVMNQWLQNFAYKVDVSWWMFVAAGFVAIFIALATVSFQSIKAALANPVKSLRPD